MKASKFLIVAFLGLMLAACSGAVATPTEAAVQPTTALAATEASTEAPTEVAGGNVAIAIELFNFPDVVEVKVGSTVTWTNMDSTQHSVSKGTPDQPGDLFNSGFFEQGETFSFTFTEVGDFSYFCMRHNHMQGIIRVVP